MAVLLFSTVEGAVLQQREGRLRLLCRHQARLPGDAENVQGHALCRPGEEVQLRQHTPGQAGAKVRVQEDQDEAAAQAHPADLQGLL